MPESRHGLTACPTLNMLHIVGMKWTIPILETMKNPRRRFQFNMLIALIGGITPKNLSKSLRELYELELVEKVEIREKGMLHTEYSLTGKGLALNEFIRNAKTLGVSLYNLDASCAERECKDCVLART